MYFLRFAYYPLLYILIPAWCFVLLYRIFVYKSPRYRYALAERLSRATTAAATWPRKLLLAVRAVVLLGLIFLVARPQWVDERSKVLVDGVAIVLAIDVSGSMQLFDDLDKPKPRIDAAKEEAMHFVDARHSDPIGVVIFGKEALSRCPLTLDKHILRESISSLRIGFIDQDGTALHSGLAAAVNRLRDAASTSKVVILLTDGVANDKNITADVAIDLAKRFGVRVYTIGIGREDGGFMVDQFGRVGQMSEAIDEALLQRIATDTGGASFRAHNQKELRTIYQKIDALEKTTQETTLFHRYHEAYVPLLLVLLVLLAMEFITKFLFIRGL